MFAAYNQAARIGQVKEINRSFGRNVGRGAARLAIAGDDPALLAGQDPARISRANRARSRAYQPALDLITGFQINWTIACYATPSWAAAVISGPSMAVGSPPARSMRFRARRDRSSAASRVVRTSAVPEP